MRTVLFDLDGTLSHSEPGIVASLRHAFETVGLPPLDDATLRSLLGPPFYESLPPLAGERMHDVIAAYRDFYQREGMLDTQAYDGIGELLASLDEAGFTLAVATSKPEVFAIPIVEHLGFSDRFTTICGDELDGSLPTKALVIDKALSRLGRPDPSTVVMIGDRAHDVVGAREHGIACIGAGWGYGAQDELVDAGATPIFEAASGVTAFLLGT